MKTLYLDCGMGAAGDMLAGALLELLPDPDGFLSELNALGLPGVQMGRQQSVKCGITGTHFTVTVNGVTETSHDVPAHTHHHHEHHEHHGHHEHTHTHSHRSMQEIRQLTDCLPAPVREQVLAVYQLIAEAESQVHGVPVSDIHFHEVGTLDAIADITAVCLLLDRLAPGEIIASPIHVGAGQVHCAHGILPVPAPATAYLLRSVPVYGGSIQGELCTPTGAALLKYFVTQFGDMPVMRTETIGYGMGQKDFEAANCVRALLGETEQTPDTVTEFCCNLDDMTPEAIGFALQCCLEAGALDAYTIPAGMKKCRPGVLLCVMCHRQDADKIVRLLFRHTTTLGVREHESKRYTLSRRVLTEETPFGTVRRKIAEGYGVSRSKYEYDDIARIACEQKTSLDGAVRLIEPDQQHK